ncbi:uncharacterized protein wu:fj19g03 isoform X2 [Myxocyprinus asiaticus]|nr:uncharacterized protein wu:fj19g03 isoform X2 [Myxocyprinus asiaticus]
MLAVLTLVLLASSVIEGWVLSKCELKNHLEDTQFKVIQGMGINLTVEDLIARLVCTVENTSGFNTSLITSIQINQDQFRLPVRPPFRPSPKPKEKDPSTKEEDDEKLEEEHIIPVELQRSPKQRPGRSVPEGSIISSERQGGKDHFWGLFPKKSPAESSGSSSEESSEEESSGDSSEEPRDDDVITWNLFGIFQLSDRVACDSGSSGTLNICRLECGALINDDITDDIICLKTLVESHGKFTGFSPKKRFLTKMMAMLFMKECRSVVPSQYFDECS